MADVYLSKAGYEKLEKELKYLRDVKRPEISKQIGEARAHGDLKENSEYHAAREAQGMTEARITELASKLANAKIIDNADIPKDAVYIGATVKLFDVDMENEIVYTLVSEDEADFSQGKIAVTSPIGKGLLGHKIGDVVKIQVPARTIQYKILQISR